MGALRHIHKSVTHFVCLSVSVVGTEEGTEIDLVVVPKATLKTFRNEMDMNRNGLPCGPEPQRY